MGYKVKYLVRNLRRITEKDLEVKTRFFIGVISALDTMSFSIRLVKGINANFHRLFQSKMVISIHDFQMIVETGRKDIHEDLLLYRNREAFSAEFFKNIIEKKSIIIDIGANIGYYALMESHNAPEGVIYAIEPVMANIQYLNENIILNNFNNIYSHNLAISEKKGRMDLYVYDYCNHSSLLMNPDHELIAKTEIQTLSLDDFIEEYLVAQPDIVRMDIEGYEYEVILGAEKLLRTTNELVIFMELHPGRLDELKIRHLIEILKRNGFEILCIINEPAIMRVPLLKLYNFALQHSNEYAYGRIEGQFEKLDELIEQLSYIEVFFKKSIRQP